MNWLLNMLTEGWVCPGCGTIHAPVTTECWCSRPHHKRSPEQLVRWATSGREPSHVFDYTNFPDAIYNWHDRDMLAEDWRNTEAVRLIGTWFQGPHLFLVSVEEDGEMVDKWFSSFDAAVMYRKSLSKKEEL